jgi:hypothetical protein
MQGGCARELMIRPSEENRQQRLKKPVVVRLSN